MKELKEIRFNSNILQLRDNIVRSSILPEKAAELNRKIQFQGDTEVDGAVYAHDIEVQQGDLTIHGAVFTQNELYIQSSAKGKVTFDKAVASAGSIVSRAAECKPSFLSDINAKSVTLYNAYVAGSIYADEITLENCVVIGGVFASQQIILNNCVVGTFNAPEVTVEGNIYMLLPSAFSLEPLNAAPNCQMWNLSLADLGDLYRGAPQSPESGKIPISPQADELKARLADEKVQKTLRSYSVVGKVLAADLLDTDKFQNHFLLTAAALGPQLLRSYDLGSKVDGSTAKLTNDDIRTFFFDILHGRILVQPLSAHFNLSSLQA